MNKANQASNSLADLGRGRSNEGRSVDDLMKNSATDQRRSESDFSKSLEDDRKEAKTQQREDRRDVRSDRQEKSATKAAAEKPQGDTQAKAQEKTRAEKRFEQRRAKRERAKEQRANESSSSTQSDQTSKSKEPTIGRITKVLGRGSMAIARSEAIALASGNVDRLSPSDIPGIMTENPFLNNAMVSDPGEFLNKEMTVGDLLSQLDLDEEVMAAAESFGVDMGEMISPKDFFKIIGIDPHVVSAQITSLKADLPKNGFTNLMEQAGSEAMAENFKKDPAAAISDDPKMVAAQASDINDAKNQATDADQMMRGDLSARVSPEEAANMQTASVHTAGAKGEATNAADAGIAGHQKGDIRSDVALSNKEALDSSKASSPLDFEHTKIDPFEKLGQKLKFAKVEQSPATQVQANVMNAADELSRLKHSGLDVTKALTIKDRVINTQEGADQLNFVGNINNNLTSRAVQQMSGLSQGMGGDDFSGQGFSSDELIETLEQRLEFDGDVDSEVVSDQNLRFDSRLNADKTFQSGAIEGASVSAESGEVTGTRTAADRAKIAENVMDKARLLLTKGGGSMAFQMKIDNSEVLDIAIKLSGNQVSLRLGSDGGGLGERLAAELGGLEASLKSQNLELAGVEVATDTDTNPQEQQRQGNDGFDERQNDQSFVSDDADDFSTFMSEVAESTEASADSPAQEQPVQRPNTSGRISVAV